MKVNKIKGRTYFIDTGMSYIPFYKINGKEIVMLDSGLERGERELIDGVLEEEGLGVAGIISTHAHIDHVGNNAHLKGKYGCTIAMPAYEAMMCSSTMNLKLDHCTRTYDEVGRIFGHMVCEVDIFIGENQKILEMCGEEFKIIHTPGHSPSQICVITPDDVAYLGDALISYELMEGAKLPYSFILKEDIKSKSKLYELDFEKYVVAHKGVYDDIEALIGDNIDFYIETAEKVYGLLKGAMSMEELIKAAIDHFGIKVGNVRKYWVVERMLKPYVDYLDETGMIKLDLHDGFLKYTRASSSMEHGLKLA